jgi:hypothetical protein
MKTTQNNRSATAAGRPPQFILHPSSFILRRGALFLVFGAVIAVFWRVVSFAGVLFHFDLIGFNAPIRAFFFGQIARGVFPLWAPNAGGGYPLFADGQLGGLYPPNYPLFALLPVWAAINLTVVLHLLLAAGGIYAWLVRKRHRAAAALGALSYALSAYLVFNIVRLMFFQTACLAPWLFLLLDRYLDERRTSDVFAAAVVIALMLTAGHQQALTTVLVGMAAFVAVYAAETWLSGSRRSAVEIVAGMPAAALLGGGIAAIVILGMLDLLPLTVRHGPLAPDALYAGSLDPRLLVRLASPLHNGRMADGTWMLANVLEKEVAAYLGLAAWILAPLALAGGGGRRDRAHLAVVLFSALCVLGSSGPFAGIWERVPVLNRMQAPARFLLPMTLSLSWLVASGVQRLLDGSVPRGRALRWAGAGALAWAAVAWGGAFVSYGATVLTGVRAAAFVANLRADLLLRTGLALGLLAAVAIVSTRRRDARRPALALGLLVLGGLVFADLASVAASENPTIASTGYGPFDTVKFLREHIGPFRLYSLDDHKSYGHEGWAQDVSSFADGIAALPHLTPLLFDLKTGNNGTSLSFYRNSRVAQTQGMGWLRRMSVKYVLARRDLGWPPVFDNGRVQIYEVRDPLPIYQLTANLVAAATPDDAFAGAGAEAEARLPQPPVFIEAERLPIEPTAEMVEGAVQVLRDEPDRRLLRIRSGRPAFLVVRESWDPGWRARLDGAPVASLRADYLFWGVTIPAGDHELELRYRPAWFRPAVAISLTTLALAIALPLIFGSLRRPRPRPDAASPDGRVERWLLPVLLALFAILLLIAVVRHPGQWGI